MFEAKRSNGLSQPAWRQAASRTTPPGTRSQQPALSFQNLHQSGNTGPGASGREIVRPFILDGQGGPGSSTPVHPTHGQHTRIQGVEVGGGLYSAVEREKEERSPWELC